VQVIVIAEQTVGFAIVQSAETAVIYIYYRTVWSTATCFAVFSEVCSVFWWAYCLM